jgi:hypothetical protein
MTMASALSSSAAAAAAAGCWRSVHQGLLLGRQKIIAPFSEHLFASAAEKSRFASRRKNYFVKKGDA